MARRKIEINFDKLEKLAKEGLTFAEISTCLSVGRSTLYEHAKTNPDILDTIRRGRASLVRECVGIVLEAARAGNWKAAATLLQRYSDAFTGSISDQERSVKQDFNLFSNDIY